MKLTREEIINKARRLAKELGVTNLPRKTFIAKTGISYRMFITAG